MFFCHFYWNDHERLYRLLGPPNLQMPSSDDQKLKDEVLLFFYVELSEVIPQKLIFGRHVSKKLTFWEIVSEEIPKSSFFRRLVAESSQIKDWPPIPVRPAAGDFDHIMMTMTVAIMMMTIVIIFMMVIMISQTTMMSPTCSSTSVQTISWMFNDFLYDIGDI